MKMILFANGLCAGILLPAFATHARAESTIAPAHPYAYGANVGWINAEGDTTNGAAVGLHYCTGSLWSANCGWISLSNAQAYVRTETFATGPDNDSDQIPDAYERLEHYTY